MHDFERATFTMDEQYFREALNEWIRSVSRGRKFEPFLCAGFFLIGLVILLGFPSLHSAGMFMMVVGVFESYRYISFKRNWLMARRTSSQFNQQVVLEIRNGVVTQIEPPTKIVGLEFVSTRIVKSKKGVFLFPSVGHFLYVPQESR